MNKTCSLECHKQSQARYIEFYVTHKARPITPVFVQKVEIPRKLKEPVPQFWAQKTWYSDVHKSCTSKFKLFIYIQCVTGGTDQT